MQTGAITGYIDVAQLVLYAFWIFFAGLVFYLRREDKREGYPLESDRTARTNRIEIQGFPAIPKPKIFYLPDGRTVQKPDRIPDKRKVAATPTAPFPGAPLRPTGDAMKDGVGAASFAEREDEPDRLFGDQSPKIVPLRRLPAFHVAEGDPDPRGMTVYGADGAAAGIVKDLWIDQPDSLIRYLEVQVTTDSGAKTVLVPFALSRVVGNARTQWIAVKSVLADQVARAPRVRRATSVTKREEDRICAYFGGGHLHAMSAREEPLL